MKARLEKDRDQNKPAKVTAEPNVQTDRLAGIAVILCKDIAPRIEP